jgi:hypothetical protein
MRLEAESFDALADGADLLLRGVGLHDDKHSGSPEFAGSYFETLRRTRQWKEQDSLADGWARG